MSEEQGEAAGAPDDEPGDGADEARERPEDEGDEESVDREELEALVEAHDAETVAREIAGLRERVDELERELESANDDREDLESRLKRKQAEFQNYKKRQSRLREQERARATEDLVERLLEVRDNLQRALEQDDDADIREGVEATFRQLDDVLREENVEPIEPDPGADVDPQRHEVLLKVEGEQPAGTVEEVHSPGYEMAEKVLRAARVTVAEDDDDAGATGDDGADEGDADVQDGAEARGPDDAEEAERAGETEDGDETVEEADADGVRDAVGETDGGSSDGSAGRSADEPRAERADAGEK